MKIKIIFTAESNTSKGTEILQEFKKQILSGEFQREFQDWKSSDIKVKATFEYTKR